ncbi:hypothetical protein CR513_15182, partial [Mucuna pruriens]
MPPYQIVFGKAITYRLKSKIVFTGQSRSVIWLMTKLAKKGNYSCRNWRSCAWKLTRSPGSTRKRIPRKEFRVSQKLRSRWDEPFVITNVFPHGAVELRDKSNNMNFKVNGHQIKLYHEGLTLMMKSSQLRPKLSQPDEFLSKSTPSLHDDSISACQLRLQVPTCSRQRLVRYGLDKALFDTVSAETEGVDPVILSSTTIAMVDGGGSPLLARTLRIMSTKVRW